MLGFSVSCATDGEEAIRLVRSRDHDALITDVHLATPRSYDGSRLVAEIKAHENKVTTIVLTTDSAREAISIFSMGADIVLEKPQPLRLLAEIVAISVRESILRARIVAGQIL